MGKGHAIIILPWEVLGEELRGACGFVVRDHVARAAQSDNDLLIAHFHAEIPHDSVMGSSVLNLGW